MGLKAKLLLPAAILGLLLVLAASGLPQRTQETKAVGLAAVVSVATDLTPATQDYNVFFDSAGGLGLYGNPLSGVYEVPSGVPSLANFIADDNVGALAVSMIGEALTITPGMAIIPSDTTRAPALVWAICGSHDYNFSQQSGGPKVLDSGMPQPYCQPSNPTATFQGPAAPSDSGDLRFRITTGNANFRNKISGFNIGTDINCIDDNSGFFPMGGGASLAVSDNFLSGAGVGLADEAVGPITGSQCDTDAEEGAIGVIVGPSATLTNGIIEVVVSDDDGSTSTQRILAVRDMVTWAVGSSAINTPIPADGSIPAVVAYNCRETVEPCGRVLQGADSDSDLDLDSIRVTDPTGATDNFVNFQTTAGVFQSLTGTSQCNGTSVSVEDYNPITPPVPSTAPCDLDGAYNGVVSLLLIGNGQASSAQVTANQGAVIPGTEQGMRRTVNVTFFGAQVPNQRSVSLVGGRCNPVSLTFQNGTPTAQVAAAVDPQSANPVIWWYNPAANKFLGFKLGAPAGVNDLLTVNFLDAVFICVDANATITMPGVS